MSAYSWLCPNELDRERLVATVRGIATARVVMFAALTVLLILSAGDVALVALVPMGIAAIGSSYLYRDLDKRLRPEYWAASGWLLTQGMLGLGIAITGGPRSPALPWLAIAVVSLVARFARLAILAGMAFLFALLLLMTLAVDPRYTVDHPATLLATAGLLFSVWIFAQALLRSDLEHRDRDALTGLPNQPVFVDQLRAALSRTQMRGGSVMVLLLDLDGFGLANDTLGPSAGDELLRMAGARLALSANPAEIVARRSADEFAILLVDRPDFGAPETQSPRTPRERADDWARSAQAALARPMVIAGSDQEIYLGASVGISLLSAGDPEHWASIEDTGEQLLAQAQLALSTARGSGPGSIMVYDVARPDASARLSLIARMRRAIHHSEFFVEYQPTFDLHTREMVGVEALVRWEDPETGLLAPGEFIPLAEETGMIEPLGTWIIEEVARQAAEWQQRGIVIDVAFNLSPRQLWQADLLPNMFDAYERTSVRTEHLVVEITESSALHDPERTLELLRDMRAAGLRLAIDDFGVGLSSLSRLREIPAQVLKIDRSFVSEITTSADGAVMVQTIIQLAHNLGMLAHAEGVEQVAELDFLRANGCEHAQGYLLGRPQPAARIPELFAEVAARRTLPVVPPGLGRHRRRENA